MVKNPPSAIQSWSSRAWSPQEDKILMDYVKTHGEGKWPLISRRTELKRSGKSCRMRWLNYLRPDIKRGNISEDEEDLIIRLHKLLGNRWSLIAGRLPGRTDNEVKNYWNSCLKKKVERQKTNMDSNIEKPADMNMQLPADNDNHEIEIIDTESQENPSSFSSAIEKEDWLNVILDLDIHHKWWDVGCYENVANFAQSTGEAVLDFFKDNTNETAENGSSIDPFQFNYPFDLKNLSEFLGLE